MDCSTPGFPVHQLQSLLKLMPIKLVMPFNHLSLCCPLLLLPSVFPSIGVFPNKSALWIRWPKYWSFTFSISSSSEYLGLISFRIIWFDLLAVQILQLKKKFFPKLNSDSTTACDLNDKAEGRPRVSKGSPSEASCSERNFPKVQRRNTEPEKNSKNYHGRPAMVLARLGLRI